VLVVFSFVLALGRWMSSRATFTSTTPGDTDTGSAPVTRFDTGKPKSSHLIVTWITQVGHWGATRTALSGDSPTAAAISIPGPAGRVTDTVTDEIVPALQGVSRALPATLG
jgi:hypothetical protein